MKHILNENYESKTFFSKNYFYSATIAVILTCILLYAFGVIDMSPEKMDIVLDWNNGLELRLLIYGFFNNFGHLNWQHVLLNMLCFLLVGLYLERKLGTIKLLLLVVTFSIFVTGIIAATYASINYKGYSGVNYAFYFYIIIDFVFSIFRKKAAKLIEFTLGLIMLFVLFVFMCFDGGTSSFGFTWTLYDLTHNVAHMSGAIVGTITTLLINIIPIGNNKKPKEKNQEIF
jgi:membrane associated rhomboid family serine protease